MSLFVEIEKDKGASVAADAISEGRFLKRGGPGTVEHESADDAAILGVAAADAASGEQVRIYLPGQYCRVQAGVNLDPSNAAHRYLAVDATGKAKVAAAGMVVAALWLPSGAIDPAADDFITVLLTDQFAILA